MVVPAAAALTALAVLIGLGTWQIERKAWKEALIATLTERLRADPVALPQPGNWAQMSAQDWEFRRVRLQAGFAGGGDALLYASGSNLRDDVKAPGYFVFTPARLPDGGTVVVNRGYVPGRSAPPAPAAQDVVGVVRFAESPSWFIAAHDADGVVWYVRDPQAMARRRNWGAVAPFYIEQEAPVPPGGLPHPAQLTVRLRNDHLQYALTWFGLAVVLVVMFAIWARRWRAQPG
jgi:cytochrome oxidase assembly protein ShyY1